MKIRLDKIGAEPFRWRETVEIPAGDLERAEVLELSAIQWSGQVRVDSPGFRLEAALIYSQTVACDRCLTPIVQDVESEIGLLVIADAPQPTEEEVELTTEDLEILFLEGEELDAQRILVEQLQLNVPMRTLCKEDCRGLCPRCGANRNLESCTCEVSEVDPRWEALRGLKADD